MTHKYKTAHIHCFEAKNPPCGQKIDHAKCCICEEPTPHIGTDGETYYKCPKCGAVGNWGEFIITGKCHEKRNGLYR